MTLPTTILCADWGKDTAKRAVWQADVPSRRVFRCTEPRGWTVATVLEHARAQPGPVLIAFDAPLGVPASYLRAARALPASGSITSFVDLVRKAGTEPSWLQTVTRPTPWSPSRPFFAVPAGQGQLHAIVAEAHAFGVELRRAIEVTTRAKPVFVKSGIPGSVGSGACALWAELAPYVQGDERVALWPFDGDLDALLASGRLVVGEIYPRAAYATALLDAPPSSRAALAVAKTKQAVRSRAIDELLTRAWARRAGVVVTDVESARASEDDFDACVTAAALLRAVIEREPLFDPSFVDDVAEGGILATGGVRLDLAERTF